MRDHLRLPLYVRKVGRGGDGVRSRRCRATVRPRARRELDQPNGDDIPALFAEDADNRIAVAAEIRPIIALLAADPIAFVRIGRIELVAFDAHEYDAKSGKTDARKRLDSGDGVAGLGKQRYGLAFRACRRYSRSLGRVRSGR